MGKNKKRARSNSSDSGDRVSSKKLMKRIKKLEIELKRQRSRSRSNSEGRHRRYRSRTPKPTSSTRSSQSRQCMPRSYSRSPAPKRVVSTRLRESTTTPNLSPDHQRSPRSWSRSPPPKHAAKAERSKEAAVYTEISNNNNKNACSIPNPVANNDMCSVVNSPDRDELQIFCDEELPTMSEDIFNSLGEDPNRVATNSFSLHEKLVTRWDALLTNGLKKGDSQTLLNNYELPSNLKSLCPPKLNLEVKAALQKQNILTDSAYVEIQNQLGKGLTALGKGISLLLDNLNKIPEDTRNPILTNLGDSGRILTNLFHRVSITRRNLLVPYLNKNLKDLTDNTLGSEFLFGSDLNEKLTSAKTLESISKELKLPTSFKSPVKKLTKLGGAKGQPLLRYQNQKPHFHYPARHSGETGPQKSLQAPRRYNNNYAPKKRDGERKKRY
ncbi:uncharacterized protein LOC116167250 [Photinus pyralis]|uniref:uncharacterized protein LOC116167250 n=1 Tax=Photinus pyralis TaxID=7054 RepID=UPI0012675BF7|nr:uncharacterized protein LOC116167250 [Photinus pyralis]